MSKAIKPTKIELARFKVMDDLGLTPNAIGKQTGRDPKTVRKYLQSEVYDDPQITQIVDTIREKEITDLYLLGAKARKHIHKLLDEGKMKAIETTAVMDRSFQQRRLLEGQSTANISTLHADIAAIKGYEQYLKDKKSKKEGKK